MDVQTNSVAIEEGVVRVFMPNSGYGFIDTDSGGSLFFYIKELLAVGLEDIDQGTRVRFVPGYAKDGRSKVVRFLEIGGLPAGRGRVVLEKGRFVLRARRPAMTPGVVEDFLPTRSYGFATVNHRRIFFHLDEQGTMSGMTFVRYGKGEQRPTPARGDMIDAVIVPGRPGTRDRASHWVLRAAPTVQDDKPPEISTVISPALAPESKTVEQDVTRVPEAPAIIVPEKPEPPPHRNRVDVPENEWIEVRIHKLRRDRVSYGNTDRFGRILVPWSVFTRAGITNLRRDEVIQARCRREDDEIVAQEVR
jgi:cold shock CspA family protein